VAGLAIPQLARRLLSEGALNAAIIPGLVEVERQGGAPRERAAGALWLITGAAGLVALLLAALMPWVVALLAPGFESGGARAAGAVLVGRLAIVCVPLMAAAGVLAAIANASSRAKLPALAPVLSNIAVLFVLALVFLAPESRALAWLAAASVAGALDWAILTACGIAGFFIGQPIRTLGGVMLVPMLLSAAVHVAGLTSVSPPYWLVALMQILIGSISGSRFAGTNLREIRTTAVQALGWILVLLVTTFIAAWLCTLFTDFPYAALVLAFSPGGIVEITVMAYAIGFHVAFIVTCQISRATLVLLVTPTLFRLAKRAGMADPHRGEMPDEIERR